MSRIQAEICWKDFPGQAIASHDQLQLSNNDVSRLLLLVLQGEICVAGSRVFVQEGIHDAVVEKLAEKAKNWVVGDPFEDNVNQGPQVMLQTLIINYV